MVKKIHAWKPEAYSNETFGKKQQQQQKKSKQIFGQENFSQLLPAIADMFHISYQTILTLSWSTPKQYFTLF